MTYASPLGPEDPGIGALDRPEGETVEDATITMLERRTRVLRRRQRAMKAKNPRLPDLGEHIPDEDDPAAA